MIEYLEVVGMPELPEVQTLLTTIRTPLSGKRLSGITATKTNVLHSLSLETLSAAIIGKTLKSMERRGKYILYHWREADTILLMHMGQAGWLQLTHKADEVPRFSNVCFAFDGDIYLHYTNPRLLGTIGLIHKADFSDYPTLRSMGPDVWNENSGALPNEQFVKFLCRRSQMIKEVLMDQTIIAGLGNLWADEVLFQAGILPTRKANALSQAELIRIAEASAQVMEAGVRVQAEFGKLPEDFLLRHRKLDNLCPKCGGALDKHKADGRHWYFCPRDQH